MVASSRRYIQQIVPAGCRLYHGTLRNSPAHSQLFGQSAEPVVFGENLLQVRQKSQLSRQPSRQITYVARRGISGRGRSRTCDDGERNARLRISHSQPTGENNSCFMCDSTLCPPPSPKNIGIFLARTRGTYFPREKWTSGRYVRRGIAGMYIPSFRTASIGWCSPTYVCGDRHQT